MQPNVTHYDDRGMVVNVEKRETFHRFTHNDKKRINIFINLGEVKNVGPEEERAFWLDVFGIT